MRCLLIAAAVGLALSLPAQAQETAPMGSAGKKAPIEITADTSLEWYRDAKMYIARDNAVAKQGPTELHGDTLTASARPAWSV